MIYPETVTLAALPNPPHHDTGKTLNLIAHQLGLPHLPLNANDPLRVFLTHPPK